MRTGGLRPLLVALLPSAIVFAVNTISDVTGVSASLSGSTLLLSSNELGSDQFVAVDVGNQQPLFW